ncbi:MAG TPA: hypothetical protein VMU65_09155 [Candidatus Saccharimonadales bacterium]|nr:hypothetical protein [Candidatus Saccharimonadales bacterium]
MTDTTGSTRSVNAAIVEGLEQTEEITLAATDVLKSITSILVPLSVYMLPNSEKLTADIDTAVDRNFGMVTKLIERQYEMGFAALKQLGSVASSN